jgi:hypothetical protein
LHIIVEIKVHQQNREGSGAGIQEDNTAIEQIEDEERVSTGPNALGALVCKLK